MKAKGELPAGRHPQLAHARIALQELPSEHWPCLWQEQALLKVEDTVAMDYQEPHGKYDQAALGLVAPRP